MAFLSYGATATGTFFGLDRASRNFGTFDLETAIGTYSATSFHLGTNAIIALSLDTSQNATFAGDVTAVKGTFTNSIVSSVADNSAGQFTRTTASATTGLGDPLYCKFQTGGDMADGFASCITFAVQDSAATANLGFIGAVRAGADNTGDLIFHTYAAGSQSEKLRISSAGNATFAGTITTTGNFTNNGAYNTTFANSGSNANMHINAGGGSARLFLDATNSTGEYGEIWFQAANNTVGGIQTSNSGNMLFFTGGSTTALTLNSSQNATFTGKVGIDSGGYTQKQLHIGDEGHILLSHNSDDVGEFAGIFMRAESDEDNGMLRTKGLIAFERTGAYGVGDMKFCIYGVANNSAVTNSNVVLQLHSSSNATFAGTISTPEINMAQAGYYRFAGNNTGMKSSSANTLQFQTSGENRLSIASDGVATFAGDVIANDGTGGTSPRFIIGTETGVTQKSLFLEGWWVKLQGHRNEGVILQGVNSGGTVQEYLRLSGDAYSSDPSVASFYGGAVKLYTTGNATFSGNVTTKKLTPATICPTFSSSGWQADNETQGWDVQSAGIGAHFYGTITVFVYHTCEAMTFAINQEANTFVARIMSKTSDDMWSDTITDLGTTNWSTGTGITTQGEDGKYNVAISRSNTSGGPYIFISNMSGGSRVFKIWMKVE